MSMKDSDRGDPLSTEEGTFVPLPELHEVDTVNEYLLASRQGGNEISPAMLPRFRTRQQAYRFAAWLNAMADTLPNEPRQHTYDQISKAIRNT